MLSKLVGIDGTTIRKYELGSRNSKPDQLLKISNALGVNINVFTDFDIKTASDVLTLLFKMDEQLDMEISRDNDADENLIPEKIYIRFKHPVINDQLAKFTKTKKVAKKSAYLQRCISK